MSFLSDIGGLLPTAYNGFKKGVDDEAARQQREADATYQKEQRDRARAIAPVEDEARVSRLKASIDADKTAGIKGGIERTLLEEQQKNLPQQLTDARIAQELQSAKTAADATTSLLAMGGQAAAYGDTAGLNKVFGHMINAGLVAKPDGSKLEPPVNTSIVQAPSGSVDFAGQPIEGRAIQATMPDGTKHYVSTKFMDDAYKRQVQAADAASVKMIKPGERAFVPRTGQIIAEGQPRITSQGYYDPETGEFVPTRPGASGAAGSRSGAGGRTAASPEAAAASAFENIYKNSEVKLQAAQIADGQAYTVRAMKQGAETPEDAARIGLDAAANPSKIVPDIDAKTGAWSGVYRNPSIQGGKPFNLAPNFTTTQDVAKMENGSAILKDATAKLLDAQGAIIAPNNPQAQAAIRDQFIKAANDPAERAKMLEIAGRGGPQEVAALTRKLDMIATYGPKPDKAATARNPLSIGGLGGADQYVAPADSPAGRAQARQADARAQRAAQDQQRADAQAELSRQFRADAQSMEPLELARKYDALRGQLPTQDAAALQQIERNIR